MDDYEIMPKANVDFHCVFRGLGDAWPSGRMYKHDGQPVMYAKPRDTIYSSVLEASCNVAALLVVHCLHYSSSSLLPSPKKIESTTAVSLCLCWR